MSRVELQGVSKSFGSGRAVDDVSVDVQAGAFMALLGPSGCGKTTLLRLVAGLERPDRGRVAIGGRVMAEGAGFVDPEDRGLGMVFQSYALWPHMTVADNVGFGLRIRRLPAAERKRRVGEALEAVGLTGFAGRRPAALSGGQQQRVALARCLAIRAPLILLDEPLANLDAHLRESMQREFRRIHGETGTTFLYVTHDQSEAMALADRIAVMDRGGVQQVGTPQDLYRRPANAMVAGFIGRGMLVPVEMAGDAVRLAGRPVPAAGVRGEGRRLLCLRTENIAIRPPGDGEGFAARVVDTSFHGNGYLTEVVLEALPDVRLLGATEEAPAIGSAVSVVINGGWLVARDAAP